MSGKHRRYIPGLSFFFIPSSRLRRRNFLLVPSLVISFPPSFVIEGRSVCSTPIMAASYLRSTTIPLSGLKRLAAKPSVGTACLVARRTKASLAQDGQQQVGRGPIGNVMRLMLTGIDSFLRRTLRKPTRLFLTSSNESVFLIRFGTAQQLLRMLSLGAGEKPAEAFHQPHSIRKLHFSSRVRCAG